MRALHTKLSRCGIIVIPVSSGTISLVSQFVGVMKINNLRLSCCTLLLWPVGSNTIVFLLTNVVSVLLFLMYSFMILIR